MQVRPPVDARRGGGCEQRPDQERVQLLAPVEPADRRRITAAAEEASRCPTEPAAVVPLDPGELTAGPPPGAVPSSGWVLWTTILASSMAFVDGSVVNVGLPAIRAGLAADPAALQWVINAYLLPLGALLLLGGAAGDRLGRKSVFIVGIATFGAASALCAGAWSLPVLLVARSIQGVAAAFVLGAEGVQMGTRMVSAAESPVHDNWKQLICSSNEGDTLLLNRHSPPAFRVLRTGFSEGAEREDRAVIPSLDAVRDLYFGGNLEASFAFSGQVAGRITEVLPVAQILEETMADCDAVLREIATRFTT